MFAIRLKPFYINDSQNNIHTVVFYERFWRHIVILREEKRNIIELFNYAAENAADLLIFLSVTNENAF